MMLVYCFFPGDEDQALKNARWMAELGDCKQHDVIVGYDQRCNPEIVEEVGAAMLKVFNRVFRLKMEAEIDGWPQGANQFFARSCAWLQDKAEKWPYFFWLEPDAIPLREGWMDALEAEYRRGGKPFMGELVDLGEKRPDVPKHMSGVGIYENPIYRNAGECYRAHDVAWDIGAKDQIMPRAHFTKMIQHYWQHGTFTSLDGIRPETVVFHSSKDGSLIDLMRRKRHDAIFPAPVLAENGESTKQTTDVKSSGLSGGENFHPAKVDYDPASDKVLIAVQEKIKVLPHNGIWVLAGDTIISDEVERYDRLDFDPLLAHVTPLIRPGDTVVDVGAFIGDHTVAYSHAVGDTGKVLAYEPNTLAFQCLVHNTDKLGNVFTFCHALGAERQVVELTDLPNAASNYIGVGGRHIHVRPLDEDASLFGKIDLMKIDVEGYELNVLKGAAELIKKFHPKLVVEINPEALERQDAAPADIFEWIHKHGYEQNVLYRHPETPFYDILCLPTESPEAAPASVVQDTNGSRVQGFPVVSSAPPPVIPIGLVKVTPKDEMIRAIEFLKDFAAESAHNRMLVMQRLTYAGLKTKTYKKKKP